MTRTHRCWAEVDLHALRQNLAWIRHRVGPQVRVATVVKADAYGHGLRQIAALLMQSGTDIFGVANLAEARHIRSVGKGWPILMLGASLPSEVEETICEQIQPTISTLEEAEIFDRMARQLRTSVSVHVKVDTGMGRLGVPHLEAPALVRAVSCMAGLKLSGLYTHYACIEDDAEFSALQARRFTAVLSQLALEGISVPSVHANNSGGLLHSPETMFNLIRPGLLVYGIVPGGRRPVSDEIKQGFRPALSFKCRVSLIKTVPSGIPLSYGGTFVTSRSTKVATLTAGYGDGYPRAAGGKAGVLIRGQRCPVLGNVTMDQTLVDVSALADVQGEDEAVLMGSQGVSEISAAQLAEWCGTIPWEILTNINYRVQRVYRGGEAA